MSQVIKRESSEGGVGNAESPVSPKKAKLVSVEEEKIGQLQDQNNNTDDENDVDFDEGLCVAEEDYQTYYNDEHLSGDEPITISLDNQDEDDVEIELNGKQYKVPYTSECHLCRDNMYLCIRKTRYRGEMKEYPAYRCIRKGCQTFRSVRKVFSDYFDGYQHTGRPSSPVPFTERGTYSLPTSHIRAEKVAIPTRSRDVNSLTLTDRMKMANQTRSRLFSEFSNKLCRDIAANRNLRPRRHDEPSGQGTLIYITKELSAHQIMELQDAVIKVLINQKKMPIPLHSHDLPLFASCPWSKNQLEQGIRSDEGFEDFASALSAAPQPPLPNGFIEKEDQTLIYRDPKPYDVPNILSANPPEKQAVNEALYEKRKSEQEAKKFDRRYKEKRLRAWKSVKKEFDLVEDSNASFQPVVSQNVEGSEYTLQQLMERVSEKKGTITKINRTDNQEQRKMSWITSDEDETDSRNDADYLQHHYSDKMGSPDIVIETPGESKKLLNGVIHGNGQLGNPSDMTNVRSSAQYSQYVYTNYQSLSPNAPPAGYYVQAKPADMLYSPFGVPTTSQFLMSPSQSLENANLNNPHEPSALSSFLTSYVPSPITKSAPIDFNNAPKPTNVQNNIEETELVLSENEEKIIETSLKFDPPNI